MDTTQITSPQITAFVGETQLYQAQVYAVDGEKYGIVSALGCFWLPIAASCLLQPAIGDTVLVSQTGLEGYVLAVLQRTKNHPAVVLLPENTQLDAQQLQITGETLRAVWHTTQTTAQQVNQHITQRFTQITQHDELRVNSQRLVIAQDWRVRAKSADIKAQQHLVIDAEKIHLG